MTVAEKIKACCKILFKSQPISTITVGVRIVECDKCEYNLKCDECVCNGMYKELKDKWGVENG